MLKRIIALFLVCFLIVGCSNGDVTRIDNSIVNVGDYTLEIKDCQYGVKNDKNLVMFIIRFTNNSDDYKSYSDVIHDKAYQNDKQLKQNYTEVLNDDAEHDPLKEVRNGESTQVILYYEIEDYSDVEIEFESGYKTVKGIYTLE